MTRRPLKDRTIATLTTDGFEKVELVIPLRFLKRAGREGRRSVTSARLAGMCRFILGYVRIWMDTTISETDPNDYDGLVIPWRVHQSRSAPAIRPRH